MAEEELRNIVIRNMLAEDLPAVLEIERASFTTPWSEISFFNELKKPRSIVKAAEKDGRVVGYVCASLIIDEGHFLDLAVHPDFRRHGIASALAAYMIEHLRSEGCKFIFLEVRVSNEQAAGLYEKCGFQRIGTRKNYYTSPDEDAVIMSLKLEG